VNETALYTVKGELVGNYHGYNLYRAQQGFLVLCWWILGDKVSRLFGGMDAVIADIDARLAPF
jgi:hypothetical protein